LSIEVDSGNAVGSLTLAGQARQSIKDISKDGKSSILKYVMVGRRRSKKTASTV
jgi:hypothetical protein